MSPFNIDLTSHTLVVGDTGSGKTFLVAHLLPLFPTPFVIFINTQSELSVSQQANFNIRDIEELIEVMEDKQGIIVIEGDMSVEDLIQIKDLLFQIGGQMCETKIKPWVTIIIDEADTFSSKTQKTEIDNLWLRGRRWGITSWAITQRPQNISHNIQTQSRQFIYFRLSPFESAYYKKFAIPIEKHIDQDYHYIILRKGKFYFEHPIDSNL